MDHAIEITREAFLAIVGDTEASTIGHNNGVTKVVFMAKGVRLLTIEQFSSPKQYFIQDINA